MQRHVEDGGVGPEDVLGPVAVVGVVVDDRHPFAPGAQVGRGDGHVVQEAEAHRSVGERVVAGGPDRAERHRCIAGVEAPDRFQAGTGRQHGRLPGLGAGVGVAVEVAATAGHEVVEGRPVTLGVDANEVGRGCGRGHDREQRLGESGAADPVVDRAEAVRTFRVARSGVVIEEPGVGGEEHRHGPRLWRGGPPS